MPWTWSRDFGIGGRYAPPHRKTDALTYRSDDRDRCRAGVNVRVKSGISRMAGE